LLLVDFSRAIRRNPEVQSHALEPDRPGRSEAPSGGLLVDVVVLSGDLPLYEAIRAAVGERNPVWRARSAEESVELLLSGRCGVLLLDMGAVSVQFSTLIHQITEQFPDVVVVAAGRREDEAAVAGLVSEGLVYRFMHKPLTARRAGMFLNAAIRSHVERRGRRVTEALLPIVNELRSWLDPRRWLLLASGLALLLAVLAGLVLTPSRDPEAPSAPPEAASPAISARSASPTADPVLSRARAAFAAGRYESPPGRNALDLYSAVLLARPGDAEARAGLDATVDRLLSTASEAARSGQADAARRIARRALSADPGNDRAQTLLSGLEEPTSPERPARPEGTVPESPGRAAPHRATLAPPASSPIEPPAAPASRHTEPSTAPRRAAIATPAPRPIEPPAAPRPAAAQPKSTPVDLRGPVSLGYGRPAAAAPARTATNARVQVQRDPLTPVIVNGGSGAAVYTGSTSPKMAARAVPSTAPVHSIAGYADPRPVAQPAETVPTSVGGPPDRDLVQLESVDPAYPAAALRARIEGWVELEFTVNAQGRTTDIEVVDAEPRGVFDAAAAEAVAAWRYRPRRVNGQDVPQRSSVTLRFNVDD